uniref:Beta-glucosidase n=1 Tax=Consolida orientalis TaxID=565971 RepID=F8R892_9MAGN|nr:beta-glucosidase [Consolida orientalis]
MGVPFHLVLGLLLLPILAHSIATESIAIEGADYDFANFNRSSFPHGFIFGSAGASYQYEGAYNIDGKGPSMWDTWTHQRPEKIADHSNGDVANDQYHHYKEDVKLMKDMGMNAYRFSISWSRVLPNGKLAGGVNKMGVQYYNNFINELLAKGLQPYATIFHWDTPQHLEDEYGGFLSRRIVSDFQDFAELCYKMFGDRVKHWITLNEPWSYTTAGYSSGMFPPNHCSKWIGKCKGGNSATEPYIITHHQILAHAAAVKVYKDKYQASQKGMIGITLNGIWMVPYSQARVHRDAAHRALDFMVGWYMEPLTYGYYPKSMQLNVGKRLPKFSQKEVDMVKGSYDFLGFNYYTANYATNVPFSNDIKPSYDADARASLATERNGVPIGPKSGSSWLFVYPQGMHRCLLYIKKKYQNPVIYITENGIGELNNDTLSLKEKLNDHMRVDYHDKHLKSVLRAIKEGVDVRGYFAWSFLDNFEWADGYTVRFGLNYVGFKTMRRYPKRSANWFKKFLLH